MPWKCFIVRPIGTAVVSLRRYSPDNHCPITRLGYHNASVVIGEEPYPGVWYGDGDLGPPKDEPKWPIACECDYIFGPEDKWQRNRERIFEGMRGSELVRKANRDLPPGAMWSIEANTQLADSCRGKPGPDGKHWILRLPNCHDWEFHAPGTNGHLWTVNGLPPELVITPSIIFGTGKGGYHGFVGSNNVGAGYVSDDVDGRRFDVDGKLVI